MMKVRRKQKRQKGKKSEYKRKIIIKIKIRENRKYMTSKELWRQKCKVKYKNKRGDENESR